MAFPSIQSLPIFSNGVHYDHYPYEQLNEYQRAIFTDATSSRGRLCSSVKQITLKSFECYLQITRQLATPRSQSKFRKVAEGFLGFLYSEKHIETTPLLRAQRAKFFISIIPFLSEKYPSKKEYSFPLTIEAINKYISVLNSLEQCPQKNRILARMAVAECFWRNAFSSLMGVLPKAWCRLYKETLF